MVQKHVAVRTAFRILSEGSKRILVFFYRIGDVRVSLTPCEKRHKMKAYSHPSSPFAVLIAHDQMTVSFFFLVNSCFLKRNPYILDLRIPKNQAFLRSEINYLLSECRVEWWIFPLRFYLLWSFCVWILLILGRRSMFKRLENANPMVLWPCVSV